MRTAGSAEQSCPQELAPRQLYREVQSTPSRSLHYNSINIMKDQKRHWNNAHREQWLHKHSQRQTEFAEGVHSQIPTASSILELGCGEGNDSIFFAQKGHHVIAADFSDVAIHQNSERHHHNRLNFTEQDIAQPLAFTNDSFDVVYARLSLHYFTDAQTRRIFQEIARVLKPNGRLFFMCKSTDDPLYGKGQNIEADMFELDGHVRHFFSKKYAETMIEQAGLSPKEIVAGREKLYGHESAFIKASAVKPPHRPR